VLRALESPAVERAIVETLDSELVDRVWQRVLSSDETQKLIERIAEAPELRAAIAAQGVGFIEDLGRQLREVARRLDDAVEAIAWRLIRRPPRAASPPQAGAVSRFLALAIDAGILNALFFAATALFGVIVSGFTDGASTPAILLGTGAWLVVSSLYLAGSWALSGRTPGMNFLNIHLEADGSERIGLRRAMLRLAGFAISVLTLGLGFLGIVFSPRRRGLPDRFADTEVIYEAPDARGPPSERSRAPERV
jgi:uncharacterized RDD family membrane protein YckC